MVPFSVFTNGLLYGFCLIFRLLLPLPQFLLKSCIAAVVIVPFCSSCCLIKQEEYALGLPLPDARTGEPLNIVFIGRLDSYKRLDWLFNSLALLSEPWKLIVVGDGPKRTYFEGLAQESFPFRSRVFFLGCLSEADKYDQIAKADLLVLPSDRSNEAFGIVQLEAMAAGRIALAFDYPRSGMGWVGHLPGLHWSHSDGLIDVLRSWLSSLLYAKSCVLSQGSVT